MRRSFQSVLGDESYANALSYIAIESKKLCQKILGETLPIDTLTIFAQSEEEYNFVKDLVGRKGIVSDFSHGLTFYVEPKQQVVVDGNYIKLLGVRQVDETRPERGYADFPVKNLEDFRGHEFVNEINSGQGVQLLELKHPDFDVRGYIVERIW